MNKYLSMNQLLKLLITISFVLFSIQLNFAQTVSTLIPEFPGDGEFSFDAEGYIYVNDSGENGLLNGDKVFKVNPETGEYSLFHEGLPIWVVGSVFDQNGSLLVTGWQAGTISRITPDGSSSEIISSDINGAGSLEIDKDGNIYVVEYLTHKVLKYDNNGNNRTEYANGSPIKNPAGLAYDSLTNNFYVSNWTNNKICKIDADQQVSIFAEIPDQSVGPIKIYGGYIFATSPQYHKIYRINMSNPDEVVLFAGTGEQGNQDGNISEATFNTPTGIGTLDGETYYVSETYEGTGRLRVIEGIVLSEKKIKEKSELKIFPNPTSNFLNLEFSGDLKLKSAYVHIFDSLGRLVKQIPPEQLRGSISISIKEWESGIYWLQYLEHGMTIISKSFLVE